jgi:uncharacterized membrane protein
VRNHQRAIIFLLFCLTAAFFVNREEQRGTMAGLNASYEDWLRAAGGEELTPPSVTLLRIDDSETGFWNWPPNPLDYAQLLQRLKFFQPKVVAMEVPLSWQGADQGLLDALRTACLQYGEGQILLNAILQFNSAAKKPEETTLSLLWPLPEIKGDIDKIPAFTNILSLPDPRLTSLGFPSGFTAIDLGEKTGPENVLSVPLLARVNQTVIPSFVLLATMLELGITAGEVEVQLGRTIRVGNKAVIPIDASGALVVSSATRAMPDIQNASILAHDPREEGSNRTGGLDKPERDALKKRVILLGLDHKGSRTVATGSDKKISQAELFAMAIATIQSNSYSNQAARHTAWIFWALIMAAGLVTLRRHRRRAVGLSLLMVLLYFTISMIVFQSTQHWISPAVPITLLSCTFLSALLLTAPVKETQASNSAEEPGDSNENA